ncbi:uncharacterized protein EDB91DRAFT_1055551, partial [Suillus paluster]|uniref:uncharacterized protein n=1 Tax=Suillus paluster TaxID=48578 RepID=UPI001B870F83
YRHAAPSGPWPWMDFDTDFDITLDHDHAPTSPDAAAQSWRGYPEALFGNWKPDQVKRSKILSNCSQLDMCSVHWLDILGDGTFTILDEEGRDQTSRVSRDCVDEFWELLQTPVSHPFWFLQRPANIRVRALFVDNMSLPVLQMLGTKFNIEPFFFSSSLNWIPSHYQEEVRPGKGDHITITLPFMRTMQNPVTRSTTPVETPDSGRYIPLQHIPTDHDDSQQIIDTQAPLPLRDGNILLLDLLAIHMVRSGDSSTIISYHPSSSWRRPSAKRLHSLVNRAGQSVYWQKIFAKSKDPTFLFLAILWYALYAWDQAFESLYTHINWLESQVLSTSDIKITRKLHIIQAHLLQYQSLLQDFQKSVDFLQKTPNPAMESDTYGLVERQESIDLMAKECANLLSEIGRLEIRRLMQSSRLKNVMDLAFATVNIEDSKHMKKLTEATVRDSSAMKLISYLTMIFLPASFTAAVFGMNVNEITGAQGQESLVHYVATSLALTCFTSWLLVACLSHGPFLDKNSTLRERAGWPIFYLLRKFNNNSIKRSPRSLRDIGLVVSGMSFKYNISSTVIEVYHDCHLVEIRGINVIWRLAGRPSRRTQGYSFATCSACTPVSFVHVLFPTLYSPTDALTRYRHAAPSGPWPWMDLNNVNPTTSRTDIDKSWRGYPRNLFGNWTPDQVRRSQMLEKCAKNQSSTIYWMDVLHNGSFSTSDMAGNGDTTVVDTQREDHFWNILQQKASLILCWYRPENIRVRLLFVDDLTSPVLRMLGTRYVAYNIEPFFFTSSINWIPSRYQEAPIHGEGDHITITLPFVRAMPGSRPSSTSPTPSDHAPRNHIPPHSAGKRSITCRSRSPCSHQTDHMLVIDLLAIHMVRGVNTSTIISYHPDFEWRRTSAKHLHSLMQLVGGSVYWQKIFSKSKDPTFVFLAILWYALYAWDESFELLDNHVSELESQVLEDHALTRELHILQAHLLHYHALLHSFEISVTFIEKTQNPAMESIDISDKQRKDSNELMKKECENLLGEIDRLEKRRMMLSSRLKNATDLAFASVNLEDSKQTRELTEATVRDSAAMKQISYLTMIFLPASFLASVFGMNVSEINPGSLETIPHYVETTISLTLLTVYIVVTLQTHSSFHEKDATFLQRAAWPVLSLRKIVFKTPPGAKKASAKTVDDMA